MAKRLNKGLSEIIGYLILLVLLIAVLVPLGLYLLSLPTQQAQAQESASSYKNLAEQQLSEFQLVYNPTEPSPALPPLYLAYTNGRLYIIFTSKTNPPIPVVIKSYLINYNNSQWLVLPTHLIVNLSEANATYGYDKAIEIPLASIYKLDISKIVTVAVVTQYGNIIYAYPPTYLSLLNLAGLLKPTLAFISVVPKSLTVIQKPQFEQVPLPNNGEPLAKFLEQYGGTVSFNGLFGSPLLAASPGNKTLELDLNWYGPIGFTTNSLFPTNLPNPLAKFNGYFNGSFTNAYLEISGQLSGYFVSPNSISLNGKAQGITLSGGFINATLKDLVGFTGNISFLPGSYYNFQLPPTSQFTLSNAKNVNIVIVNVSVNGVFNGTFKGYVNGKPETLKGNNIKISGFISNGTLVGNINTMSFNQVYISQLLGVQYLYLGGYVAGNIGEVGEMRLNSVIASASISSSKVSYLNASSELTPSMILPPTSSYNVSVDQLNGEAIVNGASGSVTTSSNTEVVFYQSSSILNPGLSVQVFDGTIDGNLYFEAPNEYIKLGSGLSFDILSINPRNINNNNGYIIPGPSSSGEVSIVTPIVLRLQFEVENPTNVTEVFTSMPVALKLYEYYSIVNTPNEQAFYVNYLGVSDVILNPPLVVSPLQNVTKTITISIPVTGILTPNIQNINDASVLNSGQIEYIEMNIGLTTSNGYTFTTEIIVTPYAVYTYPTSFS
ncbi:hypothetical protein [Stygiolobus azoricus]|uniref:Uncharacterized protein n=1 Tax=Stygiolobus azoricus TaxID=41675 RepID=A0A650CPE5_9CREN|nr:hypothetical protein [Stygiolobus azoricus]QGR19711.1 hypothetical protein D1868_06685 [Stygiolobus azoricus]